MATALPSSAASSTTSGVEPVFIKHQNKDEVIQPYEVCFAVGRLVGNASVDGVQNIAGIWRIYVKTLADRARLHGSPYMEKSISFMTRILYFWVDIGRNASLSPLKTCPSLWPIQK